MPTNSAPPEPAPDAIALLSAWLSPAYPVGAFAYSHGLETAIAEGHVTDADSLADWLDGVLRHGAGWSDAMLLIAAARDPGDADTEALALALQPSAERRLESRAQGGSFARTTAAVYPAEGLAESLGGAPTAYPVAVGRAVAAHGLPVRRATALYLQSFAANLVSAAVRLVPLGQTDGQRALARLLPVCEAVAAEAEAAPSDAIGGFSPLSDIASMNHETLRTRLFRS
jgi:urease accessory protein